MTGKRLQHSTHSEAHICDQNHSFPPKFIRQYSSQRAGYESKQARGGRDQAFVRGCQSTT